MSRMGSFLVAASLAAVGVSASVNAWAYDGDEFENSVMLAETPVPAAWEDRAKELQISLVKPNDIDLSAYQTLQHTQKQATDLAISEYEGQKLFFEGMLPVLASQQSFSESTIEGQKIARNYPYLQNAPCAYSVTSAMRTAATLAGVPQVRDALPLMGKSGPIHTCTVEDEYTFRRLGFNYFDKNKYIAPLGAIGLLNDRSAGDCHIKSKHIAGHIYFVMEDRGPRGYKDLISDNFTRYNIIYKAPGAETGTEGFWLPPGVYPRTR